MQSKYCIIYNLFILQHLLENNQKCPLIISMDSDYHIF